MPYPPVDLRARTHYCFGVKTLGEALIPSPSRECLELLAHVLKYESSHSSLFAKLDSIKLEPESVNQFLTLIQRRQKREPLAYILGESPFYGRDFVVNPSVLIPRPETEFLIEALLKLKPRPQQTILDLCTGSGCIAITSKLECPRSQVYGSDLSWDALTVAKQNSLRFNTDIHWIQANLLDPIRGCFDIILTNPPYIPFSDSERLQKDVIDYEPSMALFGGSSGMEICQQILFFSGRHLKPQGYLIMEIGQFQSEPLIAYSKDCQLQFIECIYDFQRIGRILILKKG